MGRWQLRTKDVNTQCYALAPGASFVCHAAAFAQNTNTKIKQKYKYKSNTFKCPCYFCFCAQITKEFAHSTWPNDRTQILLVEL